MSETPEFTRDETLEALAKTVLGDDVEVSPVAKTHQIAWSDRIDNRMVVACTCSWVYRHKRTKPLAVAIGKHMQKTGHQWVG